MLRSIAGTCQTSSSTTSYITSTAVNTDGTMATSNKKIRQILQDGSNNYYEIASVGTSNTAIRKTSSDGTTIWSMQYSGISAHFNSAKLVSSDATIALAGSDGGLSYNIN